MTLLSTACRSDGRVGKSVFCSHEYISEPVKPPLFVFEAFIRRVVAIRFFMPKVMPALPPLARSS